MGDFSKIFNFNSKIFRECLDFWTKVYFSRILRLISYLAETPAKKGENRETFNP